MTEQYLQDETPASDDILTSSAETAQEAENANTNAQASTTEPSDEQTLQDASSRGVLPMPEGPIQYSPNRRSWHAESSEPRRNEEALEEQSTSDSSSSNESNEQATAADTSDAKEAEPFIPVAQPFAAPVAPVLNSTNPQPAQELQEPGVPTPSRKLSGGQKTACFFLGFLFGVFGLLGVFIYYGRRAKDLSRSALNWTAVGVIIAVIINFAILFSGVDIYAMYEQYLDALGLHESAAIMGSASPTNSGGGIF